ncbi:hypothetical protein E2I00_001894, partial [Balaenoptera physalus]
RAAGDAIRVPAVAPSVLSAGADLAAVGGSGPAGHVWGALRNHAVSGRPADSLAFVLQPASSGPGGQLLPRGTRPLLSWWLPVALTTIALHLPYHKALLQQARLELQRAGGSPRDEPPGNLAELPCLGRAPCGWALLSVGASLAEVQVREAGNSFPLKGLKSEPLPVDISHAGRRGTLPALQKPRAAEPIRSTAGKNPERGGSHRSGVQSHSFKHQRGEKRDPLRKVGDGLKCSADENHATLAGDQGTEGLQSSRPRAERVRRRLRRLCQPLQADGDIHPPAGGAHGQSALEVGGGEKGPAKKGLHPDLWEVPARQPRAYKACLRLPEANEPTTDRAACRGQRAGLRSLHAPLQRPAKVPIPPPSPESLPPPAVSASRRLAELPSQGRGTGLLRGHTRVASGSRAETLFSSNRCPGMTVPDLYFINLAAADLILVADSLIEVFNLDEQYYDITALCTFMSLFLQVNMYSSVFFLTWMSFDRYLALAKAMRCGPEVQWLEVTLGFVVPFAIIGLCYSLIVRVLKTGLSALNRFCHTALKAPGEGRLGRLLKGGVNAAVTTVATQTPLVTT